MRLEAIAKPVKIRIRSGNEEHSSLESLKHNFCVEDIRALLDKRLARWLRQQKENALAQAVDDFDMSRLDSQEGYLDFIRLFFPKELVENHIASLIDLAEYWNSIPEYRRNSEWLYRYLLDKDLAACKHLYRAGSLPDINWADIFAKFENTEDAETLYLLGTFWFYGKNIPKDIEKGYQYIARAAQLRWQEAIQFVLDKTYEKEKEAMASANSTANNNAQSNKTDNKNVALLSIELKDGIRSRNDITKIKKLCGIIYELVKNNGMSAALEFLKEVILKEPEKELLFIAGLLYKRLDQYYPMGKSIFMKLSDCYQPAKWMLNSSDDNKFKTLTIYEQIQFVENHLNEY